MILLRFSLRYNKVHSVKLLPVAKEILDFHAYDIRNDRIAMSVQSTERGGKKQEYFIKNLNNDRTVFI